MKTIDRYILKEMALTFVLGLATFTFVLLMNKILRLVDLIVTKGVTLPTILELLIYILPYSLVVTVPLSILLSTLTTYGRLAADGEAIALKMAGVSLTRLMVPALLLATVATLLTGALTLVLLPAGNRAFKGLVFQLAQQKTTLGLREGIFNGYLDEMILYVDTIQESDSTLRGVFIVDARDPEEQRLIMAEEGRLASDPTRHRLLLTLKEGNVHFSVPGGGGRYRILSFTGYTLAFPLSSRLTSALDRPRGNQELTLAELRHQIARLAAQGLAVQSLQVELHKKFAVPFACLLFVFIGVPLGFRIRKGTMGVSLVLSVVFAVIYYLLIVAAEGLGNRNYLPPMLAMWLPNLLLSPLGAYLTLAGWRDSFSPRILVLSLQGRHP